MDYCLMNSVKCHYMESDAIKTQDICDNDSEPSRNKKWL